MGGHALVEELSGSEAAQRADRVHKYLRVNGPMTRLRLLQNLHMTSQELTNVVCDLYASGRVRCRAGTAPAHRNDEKYTALGNAAGVNAPTKEEENKDA